jgi:hypothetical protein
MPEKAPVEDGRPGCIIYFSTKIPEPFPSLVLA